MDYLYKVCHYLVPSIMSVVQFNWNSLQKCVFNGGHHSDGVPEAKYGTALVCVTVCSISGAICAYCVWRGERLYILVYGQLVRDGTSYFYPPPIT